MTIRSALRTGIASVLLLLPVAVFADGGLAEKAANAVGAFLPVVEGEGFIGLSLTVVTRFRPLLTIVGGLVITLMGIRMILQQDEDDAIQKSRTLMTGLISGLVLIWLVEPFVKAFYGDGTVFSGGMDQGVKVLSDEVSGLINWVLIVVAAVAIFMIVLTSFKAIFQPTSDESVSSIRKTIVSIALGLVLLGIRVFLAEKYIGNTKSPVPLLEGGAKLVSYLLGFLAMVALLIVIFAGLRMLFSFGDEELAKKQRDLLLRAGLGFIVLLVSLTIVQFVIAPGVTS